MNFKSKINKSNVMILLLVSSVLLVIIGIFGTASKSISSFFNQPTQVKNIGLNYYFFELWDQISNPSKYSLNNNVYGFNCFCNIIDFVVYILLFCGILFLTIKLIIDIFCLSKGRIQTIEYKWYFKLLTIFSIPHLAFLSINHYSKMIYTIDAPPLSYTNSGFYSFGWGTILIIIGYLICFVCYSLSTIKNDTNILSFIFDKISLLLVIVSAVVCFKVVCSNRDASSIKLTQDFSVVMFIKNRLFSGKAVDVYSIFSYIFTIINIGLIILILTIETRFKLEINICFRILLLILFILIGVFGRCAVRVAQGSSADHSLFPISTIVAIVLVSISSCFSIANLFINKRK